MFENIIPAPTGPSSPGSVVPEVAVTNATPPVATNANTATVVGQKPSAKGQTEAIVPKTIIAPAVATPAFGVKFSKADYDTIVIEDDQPKEVKSTGLKRLGFKVNTKYFLRLYPQETRTFNVHRIEDDPEHKAPIFCIGAQCPICACEEKSNPNAAPEFLAVNLVFNKMAGAFALWPVSVKQETDGDGARHKRVSRGSTYYQIKGHLASEAQQIDLEIYKPTQSKFDILVSTKQAVDPTTDELANAIMLLNESDGHAFDDVVHRLTAEEMAELKYVINMKKLYAST